MALISDLEDVALGAVGILVVIVIVALILALGKLKLPSLPSFSDLWKKLMDALLSSGNVLGGGTTGNPNGIDAPDGDSAGDGFQIHTGIEG